MLIRLEDIPPEGLQVDTASDPGDPAIKGLDTQGPLTGSFYVKKVGDQILAKGKVKGSIRLGCARCLEDYWHEVDEEVVVELRPVETMKGESGDIELAGDDLNIEFFRGDSLDMGHLTAEQISLALPMKPLCSEGCHGICSVCGAVKGAEGCSCDDENVDPRWADLKGLKDAITKKD
jgi:uncharacterized protein